MEILSGNETYLSLFFISFLAATILPLGSEWLLAAMIIAGSSIPLSVSIASTGNYPGAATTYLIGLYGGAFLIRRVLRIDEENEKKAESLYQKYGSWSLLFSWLPVVGDPLCLAGGLMKVSFIRFSVLIFAGKAARYSAVAWLAHESAST